MCFFLLFKYEIFVMKLIVSKLMKQKSLIIWIDRLVVNQGI